ncbi:hypothetical protein AWB77_02580 [Caballeronia fortuita]|uniref:Uncharacterized protein n=1 Tax=Caballeronia fortuita TaxID=1777138 RepID=A0A158B912_9BURK|nr:hypothetical protein AWB77_02580 [Caballeronia fortuita]
MTILIAIPCASDPGEGCKGHMPGYLVTGRVEPPARAAFLFLVRAFQGSSVGLTGSAVEYLICSIAKLELTSYSGTARMSCLYTRS